MKFYLFNKIVWLTSHDNIILELKLEAIIRRILLQIGHSKEASAKSVASALN